ncbi:MAG: hypothetical protein KBT04_05670, partial [Bacteroidales bacterium]|nr:hypothetical protein [Candidatus Colimorpha onthohippi]
MDYRHAGFAVCTGISMYVDGGTLASPARGKVVIKDLDPGIVYDLYVRTICTPGSDSSERTRHTFTAPCRPQYVPWCETFDNFEVRGDDLKYSRNAGTEPTNYGGDYYKPTCWQFSHSTYATPTAAVTWGSTVYPKHYITADPNYVYSGMALQMRMSTTSTNYGYTVLPQFYTQLNQLSMSFYYKCADTKKLELGYLLDADDQTTFVKLEELPYASTMTYYEHDFSLDGLESDMPTQRKVIAFRWQSVSKNDKYAALDEVCVTPVMPCPTPHYLSAVGTDGQSVTLDWEGAAGVHHYVVQYRLHSDEDTPEPYRGTVGSYDQRIDDHTMVVSAPPASIRGLVNEREYDFFVYAFCGGDTGNDTNWSYPAILTTTVGCSRATLPYKENFEIYTEDGRYALDALTPPAQYTSSTHHLPDCWYVEGMMRRTDQYPQYYIVTDSNNSGDPYVAGGNGTSPNGGKALVMRTQSGTPAVVALPRIDTAIENLYIDFKHRNYNEWNAGTLELGYIDLGNTFYPLAVVPPCFDYEDFTFDYREAARRRSMQGLDNFPNEARIAFRYTPVANSGTIYGYNFPVMIDDIEVGRMGEVKRATNLRVTMVDNSSATIEWNAATGATDYTLVYGPKGFDPAHGTPIALTDLRYEAVGLDANSEYDFYLTSHGVQGSSPAAKLQVRTACDPVAMPYGNNFDNLGSDYSNNVCGAAKIYAGATTKPLNCWFLPKRSAYYAEDGHTQSWVTTVPALVNAGNGAFAMKTRGGHDVYAVMPYSGLYATDMRISFNYRFFDQRYGNAELGIMSSPYDPTSFKTVTTLTNTTTYSLLDRFDFSDYGVDSTWGKYIALRLHYEDVQNTAALLIDDLKMAVRPDCRAPKGTVKNIVSDTAHVYWTAPDPNCTSYQISYSKTRTFTPGNGTQATTNNTYINLHGLTRSSTYYYYLRSQCDDGSWSEWSAVGQFTTTCDPTTVPYSQAFDGFRTNVSNAAYPSGIFNAAYMPDCWGYPQISTAAGNGDTTYPQIFVTTVTTKSTPNALALRSYNDRAPAVVVLPLLEVHPSALDITFDYRNQNASYGTLELGVCTNQGDTASFIPLKSFTKTTTWTNQYYDFADNANLDSNEIYYIAFRMNPGGVSHTDNVVYIDNINITKRPEVPVLRAAYRKDEHTSLNNSQLDYYVPGRSVQKWIIGYKITGVVDRLTSMSDATLYDTIEELSQRRVFYNIASNRVHNYAVKAVYAPGDTSPWSTVSHLVVDDACWDEDFEGDVSDWYFWSNNNDKWMIGTGWAASGLKGLYVTDNGSRYNYGAASNTSYAMRNLPLPLHPGQKIKWSCNWRCWGENTSYDFMYLYLVPTDTWDGSPYTGGTPSNGVMLLNRPRENSVQSASGTWDPKRATNYRWAVTWRTDGSGTTNPPGAIDNLRICYTSSLPATCPVATSVTLSDVTRTTAKVRWNVPVNDTGFYHDWVLEYGTAGFTPGYGRTIDVHGRYDTVITGLTPGQSYTVLVRRNCGVVVGNSADVSADFITDCPIYPIPYTEDFQSYDASNDVVTALTAPTNWPNNNIGECWKQLGGLNSPVSKAMLTSSTDGAIKLTGNYLLMSSVATAAHQANDVVTVLPELADSINRLKVTFDYRYYYRVSNKIYSTNKNIPLLEVGYITDLNNTETFVPLMTMPGITETSTAPGAVRQTCYFNRKDINYPATARIAFRLQANGTTTTEYAAIDNVVVDYADCPSLEGLSATPTAISSVLLTWDSIKGADRYRVEYGTKGFVRGTGDTLVTNRQRMTIGNLSLSTYYDFYVTPICNVNNGGGLKISSYPGCGVRELPYSENFEDYDEAQGTFIAPDKTDAGVAPTGYYARALKVPTEYPLHTLPACWSFPATNKINTEAMPYYTANNNTWSHKPPFTYIYNGLEAADSAGQALVLRARGAAAPAYAVLPEFTSPLEDLVLSFDYRHGWSVDTSTLVLGYVVYDDDANTFTPLKSMAVPCTTYTRIEYDFSQCGISLPATARIAFLYRGADGENNDAGVAATGNVFYDRYVLLDNINVAKVEDCPTVRNVMFRSDEADSSILGWTAVPNADYYEIEYGRKGFARDSGIVIRTKINADTLDLDPSTDYDFYVTAHCPVEATFGASGKGTFRTPCGVRQSVPYAEDFDGYSGLISNQNHNEYNTDWRRRTNSYASPNVLPQCWTFPVRFRTDEENNNALANANDHYPKEYLTYAPNYVVQGNALALNSHGNKRAVAVLPEFEEHLSRLQLSFSYKKAANVGLAEVGYVKNLTDTATFYPLRELPTTGQNYYERDSVAYTYFTTDPTQTYYPAFSFIYDGTTTYGTNYGLYIDNVQMIMPECRLVDSTSIHIPEEDYATALETGVFHVVWNGPADATGYMVEYWHSDSSRRYSTTVFCEHDTITLSGLPSMRNFHFNITTVCLSASAMQPAHALIEVPCTYYELPYYEDFNDPGYNRSTKEWPTVAFNEYKMPVCWGYAGASGMFDDGLGSKSPYFDKYYSTPFITNKMRGDYTNSSYALGLYSKGTEGGSRAIASMPHFRVDARDLGIDFFYGNFSDPGLSYRGENQIGVMSNPDDPETFIPFVILPYQGDWNHEVIDSFDYRLPEEVRRDDSTYYYLAFRKTYNNYSTYSTMTMFIDSVLAKQTPDLCRRPENVYVTDITDSSAVLHWSVQVNHADDFYISYAPNDAAMTYDNVDAALFATAYKRKTVSFPLTAGGYHDRLVFEDTLKGLSPNITYYFTVRGNCQSEVQEDSRWSEVKSFRTNCGTLPLPQQEYLQMSYGLKNVINPCWDRASTYTDNNGFDYPVIDRDDQRNPFDGSDLQQKALAMYASFSDSSIVELPKMENSPTGALLVRYNIWGVTAGEKIKLVYVPNGTGDLLTGEHKVLATHQVEESYAGLTWETYSDILYDDQYTSDSGRLALIYTSTRGNPLMLYVDNIFVDAYTACDRPSNLVTAAYGAHGLKLKWNNNAHAPRYEIAYGLRQNFDPNDPSTYIGTHVVDVNPENPVVASCELPGLTASTGYDIAVRALCEEWVRSEWSNVNSAITRDDNQDILAYNVWDMVHRPNENIQYEATTIDHENHTINITLLNLEDVDLSKLTETFTLASSSSYTTLTYQQAGASSARTEVSGQSVVDFLTYGEEALLNVHIDAYDMADVVWIVTVRKNNCPNPDVPVVIDTTRRTMRVQWEQATWPHDIVVSETPVTDFSNMPFISVPANVFDTMIFPLDRKKDYYVYLRANCSSANRGFSEWINVQQRTKDSIDCSLEGDTVQIGKNNYTKPTTSLSTVPSTVWLGFPHSSGGEHPSPVTYYTLAQSIYHMNEFDGGEISGISFGWNDTTENRNFSVYIYMGYTDYVDYGNNGGTTPQMGDNGYLVYSGTMRMTPGMENRVDFDRHFFVDQTLDKQVTVTIELANLTMSDYVGGGFMGTENSRYMTYIYYPGKATPTYSSHSKDVGSTSLKVRPDVRFHYCNHVDPCPSPDTVNIEVEDTKPTTATLRWNEMRTDYPFDSTETYYDVVLCKHELVYPDAIYRNRTTLSKHNEALDFYAGAENGDSYDTLIYAAKRTNAITFEDENGVGLLCPNTDYYCYLRTNCSSVEGDADEDRPYGGWKLVEFTTPSVCLPVKDLDVQILSPHHASITWNQTIEGLPGQTPNFSYRLSTNSLISDTMTLAGDEAHNLHDGILDLPELTCNKNYYFFISNQCDKSVQMNRGTYACFNDFDTVSPYRAISFSMPPCCPSPTELRVDSVGSHEVVLSWDSVAFEDSWQMVFVYGPAVDSQEMARQFVIHKDDVTRSVVNDTTRYRYVSHGLEPNREFRFYVRSRCGDEFGPITNGARQRTLDTAAAFATYRIGDYATYKWVSPNYTHRWTYTPYTSTRTTEFEKYCQVNDSLSTIDIIDCLDKNKLKVANPQFTLTSIHTDSVVLLEQVPWRKQISNPQTLEVKTGSTSKPAFPGVNDTQQGDFRSQTVHYRIYAEDTTYFRDWTVNVICPVEDLVCQRSAYTKNHFDISPIQTAETGIHYFRDTVCREPNYTATDNSCSLKDSTRVLLLDVVRTPMVSIQPVDLSICQGDSVVLQGQGEESDLLIPLDSSLVHIGDIYCTDPTRGDRDTIVS